ILLKLCAGIYSPSSGTVLVDDIDINKVKRLNRLEIIKNFGFIFQTGGLIGNLTLEENISLSLRYHETFSEDEIRKRVSEKLKEFHLEKAGHLYPASLSPGMRKIVSIIRGMIHSAKVLFLDEPTESVDNYMIRKLIDIIKNHAASGGIVITVTHNQDFADAIANKIAVIDEGKLLAFDQPKTIKSSSNPKLKRILQSMSKDKELADEFLKIMQSDIL
ncbi:MAG: ATP-binding cassette domain-containing protein, partial [Spirochaetota bacterium]|nr:ATP-binding cassette domain-containing protein [Spirochaetota bacterium]